MSEAETRDDREARWRREHVWDGPPVDIGGWATVATCSRCGCDESDQQPCVPKEPK